MLDSGLRAETCTPRAQHVRPVGVQIVVKVGLKGANPRKGRFKIKTKSGGGQGRKGVRGKVNLPP